MSIIVTENGKNARKLDRLKFANENELQEYLYENPDIVPIYEIDEDTNLLILSREFSTNSGPIDALGIDINGNLYIVETKLYKNTDKRTVIAQVLDYGASIWAYFKDFADFISLLDTEVNKKFGVSLNQKLSDFFELDEDQIDLFYENMKENLNRGIFKFVILMDQLENRLKDLIRFINHNSQFDIYAVELEYYKFDKFELMIPKIFGAEVKKDLSVSSSRKSIRKSWDKQSFLMELSENLSENQYESIKNFYDFSKESFDLFRWGSGKTGAFSVGIKSLSSRSLMTIKSDGELVLNLGWHKKPSGDLEIFVDNLVGKFRDIGFEIEEGPIKKHYFFYSIDEWLPRIENLKQLFIDLI